MSGVPRIEELLIVAQPIGSTSVDELEIRKLAAVRGYSHRAESLVPSIAWLFPNPEVYHSMFIGGSPGSGKSMQIHNYALIYHMQNPSNDIILITCKKNDQCTLLSEHKASIGVVGGTLHTEVMVVTSKTFPTIKQTLEDERLSDALLIFDDVVCADPDVHRKLGVLMNSVLLLKRDKNVNILIARHTIMDQENHVTKNNTTMSCIFPMASSATHCAHFMKNRGLDTRKQKAILKRLTHGHVPLYLSSGSPLIWIAEQESDLMHPEHGNVPRTRLPSRKNGKSTKDEVDSFFARRRKKAPAAAAPKLSDNAEYQSSPRWDDPRTPVYGAGERVGRKRGAKMPLRESDFELRPVLKRRGRRAEGRGVSQHAMAVLASRALNLGDSDDDEEEDGMDEDEEEIYEEDEEGLDVITDDDQDWE